MGVDFPEIHNLLNKKNGLIFFHQLTSEDAKAGGHMVKEQDFEAEKIQKIRKN